MLDSEAVEDSEPVDLSDGPPSSDLASPDWAPGRGTAAFSIGSLALVLAVAYFPLVFDRFPFYDDEGFYLVSVKRFIDYGDLYGHTRSAYGPFYYSVMGLVYKLTGMSPNLFNGRLIVLVLTTLTACIFAATVFRVSRSLLFAALCQFTTFVVLMKVAGNEPMHPASLIMLVLSIEAYALASFAMDDRAGFVILAGAAAGAIAMCKINVGLFAALAVVVGWAIGNKQFTKVLRTFVGVVAVILPFVLMFQRIYETPNIQFAVAVSLGTLAAIAYLHADSVSLPVRPLLLAGAAAVAAVVVSAIYPLLHGTSPAAFIRGVIREPLKQADHLSFAPQVTLAWVPIIVTVAGALVALALARYKAGQDPDDALGARINRLSPTLLNALLAFAALWVIGLAIGPTPANVPGPEFVAWLPAISLLGALAFIADIPPRTRLVLRFLIPLAILQSLHAYPVAGSQRAWGAAAVFAPCAIALAAGANGLSLWRDARVSVQTLVIGALCVVFTLGMALWPIEIWRDYRRATPLGLTGARAVRIDKPQALALRQLTEGVKKNCDTFYSAPGLDSLYVFTGLTPPTGLLSNHAGVLTTDEQKEVASQLAALQAQHKRVCIVRDMNQFRQWLRSSYGKGALGAAIQPYSKIVARGGKNYTVSVLVRPR
jgi:hypothetical protein